MSLTYWIPFFIVGLGNIGYHVVAKATSVSAPPFLALSVTYLVSFLLCAAAYVVTGPSLRQDLSALNWASAAWGRRRIWLHPIIPGWLENQHGLSPGQCQRSASFGRNRPSAV